MALSFALLEAFDKQLLESIQVNHGHIFRTNSGSQLQASSTTAAGGGSSNTLREKGGGITTPSAAEHAEEEALRTSLHSKQVGRGSGAIGRSSTSSAQRSPKKLQAVGGATKPQQRVISTKQSLRRRSMEPSESSPSPAPLPPPPAPEAPPPPPPRSVTFAPEMIAPPVPTLNVPSHRAASPPRSALKSPRPVVPPTNDGGTSSPGNAHLSAGGVTSLESSLTSYLPPDTIADPSEFGDRAPSPDPGKPPASQWDRLSSRTPHYLEKMKKLKEESEAAFRKIHSFSPKLHRRKQPQQQPQPLSKATSSKSFSDATELRSRRSSMFLPSSLSEANSTSDGAGAVAPFHRDPLLENAGEGFDDFRGSGGGGSDEDVDGMYDGIIDDDPSTPRTPGGGGGGFQRQKSAAFGGPNSPALSRHRSVSASSRKMSATPSGGGGGGGGEAVRPRRLDSGGLYSTASSFYEPPASEYPQSFIGSRSERSAAGGGGGGGASHSAQLRSPLAARSRTSSSGYNNWDTAPNQQQQPPTPSKQPQKASSSGGARKNSELDTSMQRGRMNTATSDGTTPTSRRSDRVGGDEKGVRGRLGVDLRLTTNRSPSSSPSSSPRLSPRNSVTPTAQAVQQNRRPSVITSHKNHQQSTAAAKLPQAVIARKVAPHHNDEDDDDGSNKKQRLLSDLFVWEAQRKERLAQLALKVQAERDEAAAKQEALWKTVAPVTMSQGSRWLVDSMHDRRISAVDHSQMVSAARAREARKLALGKMTRDALDLGKQQHNILAQASATPAAATGERIRTPRREGGGASNGLPTTPHRKLLSSQDHHRYSSGDHHQRVYDRSPRGGVSGATLNWWMSRAHEDTAYARNH